MKNLHLISTEKPSRLYVDSQNNICTTDVEMKCGNKRNIYITNDEEIKEGDIWYDGTNIRKDFPKSFINGIDKKIILTTDQDLIKDGVQEIDEEFLQWFVKNSSCERVEVEFIEDNWGYYEIIIPKEEPKDVILGYKTSLDAQMLNSQYVDFSNPNADKISSASTTSFKQETHICKHCGVETTQSDDECYAKQERMYSEKDMKQYAWQCVANFLSNSKNEVEQNLVEVIIDRNNDVFNQFKK
jgi:translation initiation factor 2 beta subunit (eIF-2beta)/eIF-5